MSHAGSGELKIAVKKIFLLRLLTILKNSSKVKFDILVDCFAVDYILKGKGFLICYKLRSSISNEQIFITMNIRELEVVPSISILFPSAEYYELEIYDMFGIEFSGISKKRIMSHGVIDGFPLRKDF